MKAGQASKQALFVCLFVYLNIFLYILSHSLPYIAICELFFGLIYVKYLLKIVEKSKLKLKNVITI